MSRAQDLAPLYEEKDIPGVFTINLRTGECAFLPASLSENEVSATLFFQVNALLSKFGMETIRRLVTPYVANLCSNVFIAEGRLPEFTSRGRKACDAIDGICRDVGERLEMLDSVVSAELLVKSLPLENAWPENMDVEQASLALTAKMASEGKKVVGDLRRAFCGKLEEEAEEGRELSPSKRRFLDEEMESLRKYNPLYQKPSAGGA